MKAFWKNTGLSFVSTEGNELKSRKTIHPGEDFLSDCCTEVNRIYCITKASLEHMKNKFTKARKLAMEFVIILNEDIT